MHTLRTLFLICGLAVFGAAIGNADSLTEYFTLGTLLPPPTYQWQIGADHAYHQQRWNHYRIPCGLLCHDQSGRHQLQ